MVFDPIGQVNGEWLLQIRKKINVQVGAEKYCIEHSGVALHPNDRAMQIYADRIITAWIKNGMINENEVTLWKKVILSDRKIENWRVYTRLVSLY